MKDEKLQYFPSISFFFSKFSSRKSQKSKRIDAAPRKLVAHLFPILKHSREIRVCERYEMFVKYYAFLKIIYSIFFSQQVSLLRQ